MTMETLILVEVKSRVTSGSADREIEATMLRSYESKERANEDLDLLAAACADRTFKLITVPHVER